MTAQKAVPGERRTAQEPILRAHGNSYNLFILVLTLYSLTLMVVQLLPLSQATHDAVSVWDNAICVVFLIDFGFNLHGAHPKRAYFIGARGWLDLIGSIPTFGVLRLTALLRLARLSRLARIARIFRGQNQKELLSDVLHNRSQYATFITVLLAGMVLSVASIMVLQFESQSPDANIATGGDALWWAIVTITTVGYGDFYPVTPLGRITGVFVMFAGVGIIGALASILASLLVAPSSTPSEGQAAEGDAPVAATTTIEPAAAIEPLAAAESAAAIEPTAAAAREATTALPAPVAGGLASDAVAAELASLRGEVAALRASLERGREPAG